MSEKSVTLPDGSCFKYRIPNVVEQLRLFGKSKFYSQACLDDIYAQTSGILEHAHDFVTVIEGAYKTFQEILDDRNNLDPLIDFALDLANQGLKEIEKKP